MVAFTMGLGLLISLLFSGIMGVMAGGMIVPAYLALEIQQPTRIAVTMLVALGTYGLMQLIGNFVFLYGRRRFLLTVLAGFLLAMVFRSFTFWTSEATPGLAVVGLVVPGLMANWMQSQGALRTLAVASIVTLSTYFVVNLFSALLPSWFIA